VRSASNHGAVRAGSAGLPDLHAGLVSTTFSAACWRTASLRVRITNGVHEYLELLAAVVMGGHPLQERVATKCLGSLIPTDSLTRRRCEVEDLVVTEAAQLRDTRLRVIYDGDSERLLAIWYFGLRASEEVARSERYSRPLTLVVVELDPIDCRELELWFSSRLRATDMVCREKPGSYFVLLLETNEAQAWAVSERLLADFPAVSLTTATVPSQLERFDTLIYRLH
jgi:hypothetical protein